MSQDTTTSSHHDGREDRRHAGKSDSRLRDVDYFPPLRKAIPLGIQHVLAMFVSNAAVPLIIAGAAGLSGADTSSAYRYHFPDDKLHSGLLGEIPRDQA